MSANDTCQDCGKPYDGGPENACHACPEHAETHVIECEQAGKIPLNDTCQDCGKPYDGGPENACHACPEHAETHVIECEQAGKIPLNGGESNRLCGACDGAGSATRGDIETPCARCAGTGIEPTIDPLETREDDGREN